MRFARPFCQCGVRRLHFICERLERTLKILWEVWRQLAYFSKEAADISKRAGEYLIGIFVLESRSNVWKPLIDIGECSKRVPKSVDRVT
jgi:hypothetical protein